VQLTKSRTAMEQRWGLRKENKKKSKKENRDKEKKSKDSSRESQEKIKKENYVIYLLLV